MNYVFRCYAEKKPGFNLEARQLFQTLKNGLNIPALANLRVFHRYDVDEIDFPIYLAAKASVFSDPAQDDLYEENLPPQDANTTLLVAEALPGHDLRARACADCLRILSGGKASPVACATVYALTGELTGEELARAQAFLIPARTHRAGSMDKPTSLVPCEWETAAGQPAAPLAVIPAGEDKVLTLHARGDGLSPFQSLHVTGRPDPVSAALEAHWNFPQGGAQEYYHPEFADRPLDASLHVCLTQRTDGHASAQLAASDLSLPHSCPAAAQGETTIAKVESILRDPDLASQRGLAEGHLPHGGGVLVPFGGRDQLTPAQVTANLLPGESSDGGLCSVLSASFRAGYASCAAVEALAKLVAAGCDPAALTLIPSGEHPDLFFAASVTHSDRVLSPEFKGLRHPVYLLSPAAADHAGLTALWAQFHQLAEEGKVLSAWAVGKGGIVDGIMKMAYGNGIGFALSDPSVDLFAPRYGALLVECALPIALPCAALLGKTTYTPMLELADCFLSISDLLDFWQGTAEGAYPTKAATAAKDSDMADIFYPTRSPLAAKEHFAAPRAVIPVFPGCDGGETADACLRAGIVPQLLPIDGFSPEALADSASKLAAALGESQLLLLPGGASAWDEPAGAGKLTAAYLRQPRVADAIHDLLKNRDGLALGLGNGFQTLVRLGLLPFGEIRPVGDQAPTFTRNLIGRRQSRYVTTRIASLNSPWMLLCNLDEIHTLPVCHTEGRLVLPSALLTELMESGQIATQYVDTAGIPSLDISVNPGGAVESIEGLFSPDGRVFGKLARSERAGDALALNIPGYKYQPIFEGAAQYYK